MAVRGESVGFLKSELLLASSIVKGLLADGVEIQNLWNLAMAIEDR